MLNYCDELRYAYQKLDSIALIVDNNGIYPTFFDYVGLVGLKILRKGFGIANLEEWVLF
jgi:hypothetical protein